MPTCVGNLCVLPYTGLTKAGACRADTPENHEEAPEVHHAGHDERSEVSACDFSHGQSCHDHHYIGFEPALRALLIDCGAQRALLIGCRACLPDERADTHIFSFLCRVFKVDLLMRPTIERSAQRRAPAQVHL